MIDILIPDRLKLVIKNYAISGLFAEMLIQGESSGKPMIVYISKEGKKEKVIFTSLDQSEKVLLMFMFMMKTFFATNRKLKDGKLLAFLSYALIL